MKRICFAVVLFLSLAVSCALAAKDEKSQAPKSIAVRKYTGDEEKPVTLPAGFKLTRESVLKNVDDKTAVILIYNGTGRNLSQFQLDLEAPGTGRWAGQTVITSHGLGPLLKGEKRVIKAKGRAPFRHLRLLWEETAGYGNAMTYGDKEFKGGVPYVFTILKGEKRDGNATWGGSARWEKWRK